MKRDQSEHLFLMLLFLRSSASERFLVVGPAAPVVVSPGEDAVLPCSLSPSISAVNLEIRWFREDYNDHVCLYQNHMYVPQSTDSSYNGRVDLFLQNITEGNVSLNLRAVIPSDDGPYKCMVVSSPYYEEAVINVRVTALGSQPSVSLHSPGGGQTQLLCRSEGWFPAPAVIWTDRDGHDVTSLSRTTVDRDSQGFLSVSSYIPVQQESNIFSCLVRSALPKPDWGSQLHIPRDFFPGPSGWMVALCVTAAVAAAASALLVIQWRRMDKEESLWESEIYYINVINAIPVILKELDAVKQAPIPKSQWQWLCSAAGEGCPIPDLQWQWLCSAAADLSLDPDTANPRLSLSEDGKRVRRGEKQDLPDNPERFDCWRCVLSREGLSSGRRYWEVEMSDEWRLGVIRESAQRKGGVSVLPQEGYWCLDWDYPRLSALTAPKLRLPLTVQPRTVGVCVDIEERKVSFYAVESRTHIFTFTDMEFSQGEKIYALFCTWDSEKDLVLLPPARV
nr:PREDICTED: butyrophilin subfamily 1 member A1-like isoform X5 [Lepisosteus oculatus]XP_015201667.1 PREDICTED: butyrophilin subfamily 1 member A1-like isoform X5 [Lepisosteus oculatus]